MNRAATGTQPGVAAALALALVTALVVAAAPLVVYAGTLALLGFAHVVVELRYVRRRFAGRIEPALAAAWIALLLLLALLRALDFAGVALAGSRVVLELGVLAALLLVTGLAASGARRAVAVAATAGLASLFLAVHPAAAIALLAFLHNLTPLGFLAERLDGTQRRRWLVPTLAVFVAIPLLIAGGAFDRVAGVTIGLVDDAFLAIRGIGAIGPAADHFGAYLPPQWRDRAWAPRLFAAAVYLQCAHYFVVLHVLPRLLPTAAAGSESRSARLVAGLVVFVGVALAVGFARSFADARALYGIAAAVHAFVEWPLFLALLCGIAPERRASLAPAPAAS